ncbi:MAG: holo-ACP synthase [Thermoguttaceae bacterium]|nr:holo-ACP synthase [Thermoguttaceae bacterium]
MRVIGIGTDITEIDRISQMVERHARSFLDRVFTPNEQLYCGGGAAAAERYAARWAAKEAVLKALGTGWSVGIAWTDVEVVKLPSGAVSVALSGGAARRAEELGVTEVLLSVSHGKNHAVAFAVAQGPEK